ALVDDADARAQPPQRAGAGLPGIGVGDEEAPFARPERGAEDANERRLAGSRRPDHGDPLAAAEGERDVAQRALPVGVDEPGAFEPKAVHLRPRYFTSPAERAAASMPS